MLKGSRRGLMGWSDDDAFIIMRDLFYFCEKSDLKLNRFLFKNGLVIVLVDKF